MEHFIDISLKNKRFFNGINLLEYSKLIFSSFIFFVILLKYLSRKHRYLQRRNVTTQHDNYFMINCSYIFVTLFFAILFGLFSYYFPKLTLSYLVIKIL